jgi:hypothetical protein
MEKPTIWSNRPDTMGRTVTVEDPISRRARYGRIRPMEEPGPLRSMIARIIPMS